MKRWSITVTDSLGRWAGVVVDAPSQELALSEGAELVYSLFGRVGTVVAALVPQEAAA